MIVTIYHYIPPKQRNRASAPIIHVSDSNDPGANEESENKVDRDSCNSDLDDNKVTENKKKCFNIFS
jgi:hypothetical protein